MALRYCFEESEVVRTLRKSKSRDLAVIDTDGIDKKAVQSAVKRGVFVYGYLNAGALEKERSYYSAYKSLRIAPYDGWPGEYWVDVTADAWKKHLIETAQEIKATGAIGLYFDNADIYYMCGHGFGGKAMRKAPTQGAVFKALLEVVREIVHGFGLVCMINGGDEFVRKLVASGYKNLIATVNQEGVLYEDFKKQSSSERKYRTEYLDWCKKQGFYVRGIEYCVEEPETAKEKATYAKRLLECKTYYAKHGWYGLYVSKHTDLMGD